MGPGACVSTALLPSSCKQKESECRNRMQRHAPLRYTGADFATRSHRVTLNRTRIQASKTQRHTRETVKRQEAEAEASRPLHGSRTTHLSRTKARADTRPHREHGRMGRAGKKRCREAACWLGRRRCEASTPAQRRADSSKSAFAPYRSRTKPRAPTTSEEREEDKTPRRKERQEEKPRRKERSMVAFASETGDCRGAELSDEGGAPERATTSGFACRRQADRRCPDMSAKGTVLRLARPLEEGAAAAEQPSPCMRMRARLKERRVSDSPGQSPLRTQSRHRRCSPGEQQRQE